MASICGAITLPGCGDGSGTAVGGSGGPLECTDCTWGGTALSVRPHSSVSFGVIYVRNHGDSVATLDGVRLLEPSPGIRLQGMELVEPDGTGVPATERGWPPKHPGGTVRRVRGYRLPPAGGDRRAVAVLLGVAAGERSTMFRGAVVSYHVGDKAYEAVYRERLRLCVVGLGDPATQPCTPPPA
jgi:hypothetical protein